MRACPNPDANVRIGPLALFRASSKRLIWQKGPAAALSAAVGPASSFPAAVKPPAAGEFFFPLAAAGDFQFPLHPRAQLVAPVETAELDASGLRGEACSPLVFARRRSADRLRLCYRCRPAPAFAVFWIFQIIAMHLLPRWLEPTTAGWRPPARTQLSKQLRSALTGGLVGRECWVICIRSACGLMPY